MKLNKLFKAGLLILFPIFSMAQVVPVGFIQKKVSSDSGVGNIVTNGLALNLDAGNTASYPGSGTTWTDLSGNGNSVTVNNTFSNSVANGSGAFDFLGNSNNTIVKSSINGVNSSVTGGISIETWVKHTNVNQYQFWVSNAATSYRVGTQNGGGFFWDMGAHIDKSSTQYTMPIGIWKQVIFTGNVEAGNVMTRIYVDGVLKVTLNEGGRNLPNLTDILIGSGESSNLYLFNGKLSILRIFNRALTSAEVTQNYEALKSRFGL